MDRRSVPVYLSLVVDLWTRSSHQRRSGGTGRGPFPAPRGSVYRSAHLHTASTPKMRAAAASLSTRKLVLSVHVRFQTGASRTKLSSSRGFSIAPRRCRSADARRWHGRGYRSRRRRDARTTCYVVEVRDCVRADGVFCSRIPEQSAESSAHRMGGLCLRPHGPRMRAVSHIACIYPKSTVVARNLARTAAVRQHQVLLSQPAAGDKIDLVVRQALTHRQQHFKVPVPSRSASTARCTIDATFAEGRKPGPAPAPAMMRSLIAVAPNGAGGRPHRAAGARAAAPHHTKKHQGHLPGT